MAKDSQTVMTGADPENGVKRKDIRKSKRYLALKRSLQDSLQARGLVEQVYQDKMTEYLDFWVLRQELQDDIAARGLVTIDERGRSSENRSISLSIQVSRQMLQLYTSLGFKDEAAKGGFGGDADDEL